MTNENSTDAQGSVLAVQRLRQEIEKLTRLHADALQRAIYLGMTFIEGKEYDQRRSEIAGLVKQLESQQRGKASGYQKESAMEGEAKPDPSRPWPEIADEAAHEENPQKLTDLSKELIRALDEQLPGKKPVPPAERTTGNTQEDGNVT